MCRTEFEELRGVRRTAKESGDLLTGMAAAVEMVERRGRFEDYCWLAWFHRELADVEAARIAIREALNLNPGHAAALAFLQELDAPFAVVPQHPLAAGPDETVASNQVPAHGPARPASTAEASSSVDSTDTLRRRAAGAADSGDWRAVMEAAAALVQRDGSIEHYAWLIRAQIHLDLYGRAEKTIQRARNRAEDVSSFAMLDRLARELSERVAARARRDLYVIRSSMPLTDETIWLVMERPAKEIARFKTEDAAMSFLDQRRGQTL